MIAWLGTAEAGDRRLVGGKAASLSILSSRFPVPPAFVVAGASHPGDVTAALEHLGSPYVAVRSSGLAEDGVEHSFAGVHESYLGLTTTDSVVSAIADCRASARSERARAYASRHGLPDSDEIAVLVQALVLADVSAVAFTRDPVSPSGSLVVTANFGLGESVVSGAATPDTYRVSRAGAIEDVRVGAKECMTVLADGGTREVPVPRGLRGRRALDDEAVLAIAELALEVEAELGLPCDVECAFAGTRIALLQARPITSSSGTRPHRAAV